MDEKRLKRYKEKISVIELRSENIASWIHERDEKSVLAIYKAFQELVESFTDICSMMLKDMSEIVEDDYSNIETLQKKGIFNQVQESILKESNGLRNRLIHEYNGLERKTAINSILEINQKLDSIIEVINTWIKKTSKQ